MWCRRVIENIGEWDQGEGVVYINQESSGADERVGIKVCFFR